MPFIGSSMRRWTEGSAASRKVMPFRWLCGKHTITRSVELRTGAQKLSSVVDLRPQDQAVMAMAASRSVVKTNQPLWERGVTGIAVAASLAAMTCASEVNG